MNNQFDFGTNWLEWWNTQSKVFHESANSNLKNMFNHSESVDPTKHMQQITAWLETLKAQWQMNDLTEQQKTNQQYWMMMGKMCSEASDLMLKEWIKRTKENNPVHNVHELYELWLGACSEVYQKAMQQDAYPKIYGDMLNTAFKFWTDASGNKK